MTARGPLAPDFTNTELPDVIELRGVSQSYDGGKSFVIKDLDMLIEDKPGQGQFTVILGESGCGKSTLLRYIAALQQPTEGQVLLNGRPIEQGDSVSMVFQQYSSFPWLSVLENVVLPMKIRGVSKSERNDRAMEMIRKVGLLGHEKKFAQYPTLSGGQMQRVAIARSLVSNPNIILMDEPFGALDVKTRFQMQLLLAEIWESLQSTIVFVTHDVSEAVFLGDDIYIMKANPASIVGYFSVDLPFHRNRETEQDPRFLELVREIKSTLYGLPSFSERG